MILYDNIDNFQKTYTNHGKKWNRCIEALRKIETIDENTYYSIGDSLVYMLFNGKSKDEYFTGYKRYFDIHYYVEGTEEIEYALKDNLQLVKNYDDTTDKCFFKGQGTVISSKEGGILVCENNEAYKFTSGAFLRKMIIKITVER